MKTLFFIVLSLLSILWIYLSFHFFKLDVNNNYSSNFFESIFFLWLFVFWFFLWRFFAFDENKNKSTIFIEEEDNEILEEKNKTEEENLKIIEWIGPKVEELLKLNGIKDIKQLSVSNYDDLKMILERAWDNFKIINPRSWPYQAELAYKKEWGKLKEYQDFLIWGIDPNEFNK